MKLKVSDGGETSSPSIDQVSMAVQRLALTPDEFVILERDKGDYVQIAGGVLEYRSGGQHFRAAGTPVSAAQAERVFAAFFDGGDAHRRAIEWVDATETLEREFRQRRRGKGSPRNLLLGILAIAIVYAYYYWRTSG